jgi:hypothetical protein
LAGYVQIDLRGASEAILIVNKLELPLIAATSPELTEAMRSYSLREALSRTPGSCKYVLANPKDWLGSCYHQVLEKIANACNDDLVGLTVCRQAGLNGSPAQTRDVPCHSAAAMAIEIVWARRPRRALLSPARQRLAETIARR